MQIGLGLSLTNTQNRTALAPLLPTYHLNFDGVDDKIVVSATASLSNMPMQDMTIEWVGNISIPGSGNGPILAKINENFGGLIVNVTGAHGTIEMVFTFDEWNGYYNYGIPVPEGINHIEIVWDSTERTALFFVNGVLTTQTISDTAAGTVYDDEEDYPLQILHSDFENAEGQLNWLRISNIARHTSNFTPPSLTACPPADANTVLRLALDEGTGVLVNDTSGNNNNGTITGATWENE